MNNGKQNRTKSSSIPYSHSANNNDSMKKHRIVIENENNKNSVLISANNSIEKKKSELYSPNTNLNDDEVSALKQKLLSDVYYIKTSPKPKPTSPFERRRMRNLKPGNTSTLSSRNSSDDLNLISTEPLYNPLQKYRSNDLTEHQKQSSIHSNEDKSSSLQSTYKCFSMKHSKNPATSSVRRDDKPRFGEMPSTSFEHVNVARLCSDNVLKDDDDDYVRSLRLAAAKLKPSSPQHISLKEDSQVKIFSSLFIFGASVGINVEFLFVEVKNTNETWVFHTNRRLCRIMKCVVCRVPCVDSSVQTMNFMLHSRVRKLFSSSSGDNL